MEYARRIPHPRSGIPAWHWEPKDVRPDEGEYWSSRGVGYDLSGFVRTKAAGERILAMVHEVLETDKCESYLDYRPSEPTWIQFNLASLVLKKPLIKEEFLPVSCLKWFADGIRF